MTDTSSEPNFTGIPAAVTPEFPSLDETPDAAAIADDAVFDADTALEPPAAEPEMPETFRVSGEAIKTAVIALVFLVVGFIGSAIIFNGSGVSAAEIESLVRSIVAEQLAVSIGQTSGVDSRSLVTEEFPSFGPPDAPVTIVEFSDFFCYYCTRFANETLPLLRMQYGDLIRFVYRDMPVQGGTEAAIAGSCAQDQGRFWEFHDLMFANSAARDRETFIAFAGEVGMNTTAFRACMDNPKELEEVTLDYVDGDSLGIMGTPRFYVNDRIIAGARPFSVFELVINRELEKAGITPPEPIGVAAQAG